MKRIIKDPLTRRTEILQTAGELVGALGYQNTSIESIINKAGIAKGTFYYYFKSKEDILEALAHVTVEQVCEEYKKIAADSKLNSIEKAKQMLSGQSRVIKKEKHLMEALHQPENRELHERINVEIIKQIAPIFANVVEQGKKEGVFNVEFPLETVQFLLAGSQFLLESNLFEWSEAEQIKHIKSMQAIIERALGAKSGSFNFI